MANETAEREFQLAPGVDLARSENKALWNIVGQTLATQQPFRPRGYESAIGIFRETERYFQPQAVPILSEDKTLVGVTLVLSDVTSLRILDMMKSGLLSVVSHELKTPLTSIRMATHLLLEGRVGPLTAQQADLLQAAREDGDRLHGIIDNLLDLGRLQSGRGLLDLEPVPVQSLVEDAVAEFATRYRSRGVQLEVGCAPDSGAALVDTGRVRHVFANLLENALRFTPGGGRVSITSSRSGEFVEFAVADTGSGIAPEDLPRIFDRFYRAAHQAAHSGAGLGLAIVKEIVEAHGGTIFVQSEPARGTTFRFSLRAASSADAAASRGEAAS
jgi:signal transduction histidine kinase